MLLCDTHTGKVGLTSGSATQFLSEECDLLVAVLHYF